MTKRAVALLAVALLTVACAVNSAPSPTPAVRHPPRLRLRPGCHDFSIAQPNRTASWWPLPPCVADAGAATASTFLNGPMLTVSDGVVIDNNVAIPLIFPGPLMVLPNATPITEGGEQAMVDQARELGLLDGATDLTGGGVAPGGVTANLLMVLDGTRFELTGSPDKLRMCGNRPCQVDPATPEAFAAYWWLLQDTSTWLGQYLGPSAQFQPERLAVLVVPPATENSGISPNELAWPLADFAAFGVDFAGGQGMRCATVIGDDVDTLLPVLLNANQMTVFVDGAGAKQSLNVRTLVPLEPSPCPDGPG